MQSAGHLTQEQIDDLKPDGEQYVVWEGALPGFGVRVSPGGAKSYVLKYRLDSGRVRWKTIARAGVLSLKDARKRARRDLGVVADNDDPLSATDAARAGLTLGEVATRFLEQHVEARRKPATQRLYKLVVNNHLRPKFGTTPIAEVTMADVVKLHHRLRATPYLANRVLAVTSKLMAWAEQQRYREAGTNPARGIEKYREEPRRRYLTTNELKRLGCALRVGERRGALTPSALTAIRLLTFTGARVSEILGLRWIEVDLPGGALNLADSKTGRKVILLSAPAREVLDAWPKWAGSPFVFPGERRGKNKGEHRVDLNDAWSWVRRRAKIPDVRLHDLRHSYASIAVSAGQTLPIIGALLGHSQPATTARYAHLMDHPLRAASEQTAATIAASLDRRPRS